MTDEFNLPIILFFVQGIWELVSSEKDPFRRDQGLEIV